MLISNALTLYPPANKSTFVEQCCSKPGRMQVEVDAEVAKEVTEIGTIDIILWRGVGLLLVAEAQKKKNEARVQI